MVSTAWLHANTLVCYLGVYFNGERIIDRGIANDVRVVKKGDVTIATHKFHLPLPV